MAENNFRSRLNRLFSTQVVVRRIGKNRIRVVDTSKLQSVGTQDSPVRGRYTGLHTYRGAGARFSNAATSMVATKLELYRDYECLSGDTEIPMVDGSTKTLFELSELYPTKDDKFYVYSYDHENDRIQLGEAHSVRKTKTAQTYKVMFDDDSFLIATENHPFLMRDGNYKRVDEISVGDSVMPFYQNLNLIVTLIEDYDVRDVYDMTVEKFHNFATTICFVHNSMDEDPILSSALDIYADESTVVSADGIMLKINSPNDKVKQILHNLFYDILNIEFNLWPWIRNTCKYGDFMLALDLDEEMGVVNAIPVSAYDLQRVEGLNPDNPYEVKFIYQPTTAPNPLLKKEYEYYEIAHFRLLADTNFLPNGRSMLEPARKEFKRLVLMEDAMMIHRIMRAPQRRVYRIAVGNINPNEVDQYMQKIIDSTKKIPYIDETTGQYNLKFNLQNMIEDIYIPTRGGEAGTEVDTLQGMDNAGFIDDVEYIRNKMMAALKIPKAFLGYDENVDGKSVLASEDVRFSRTIERIQRIVESELNKVAIIHLFLQGYQDASLIDFELTLNNPSIVYKRQQIDIMNEQVALSNSMKELRLFSRKYIYENIFGLSSSEWEAEEERVLQDQKLEWRIEQLNTEGNDPLVTGVSKGTPDAIARMHVSKRSDLLDDEDVHGEKEETRGRPENPRKFGSHKDTINGRDPLGFRNAQADIGATSSPLSQESLDPSTKLLLKNLRDAFRSGEKLDQILTEDA